MLNFNFFKALFSLVSASFILFLKPWEKLSNVFRVSNDFILFKKESPINFDVNTAIDQLNTIKKSEEIMLEISQISENLKTHAQNLDNTNISKVKESFMEYSENFSKIFLNLSNHVNLFTFASVFALLASCFFMYKYFTLKKKFITLSQISKDLVDNNKKLLDFVKINKINFNKNNDMRLSLLNELKSINTNLSLLKEQRAGNFLNKKLVELIEYNQKKLLILQFEQIYSKLHLFLKKIKDYNFQFSKEKISYLHHKFIISRNFEELKFKKPYLLYSSITLLTFYFVLELGLSDSFRHDFLASINNESFPVISGDPGLVIQDFDIPSKNLEFHTISSDNIINKFHKISKKKCLNVFS